MLVPVNTSIQLRPALLRDEPTIRPPDDWHHMDSVPTSGEQIWVLDDKSVAGVLWANPEFKGQGSLNYVAWAPYTLKARSDA